MKCQTCGAENALLSKFCQACGTPLATLETAISRQAITPEWLAAVALLLEYKAEVDGAFCTWRHANRPTIQLGTVATTPPLISMQISWSLGQKVPLLRRWDFAEALNKANNTNWICSFTTSPDLTSVSSSTAMHTPESLLAGEVANYANLFINASVDTLSSSGILKFAK